MSLLCEMSSSTGSIFDDLQKDTSYEAMVEKAKGRRFKKETLESVIAELRQLEADPLVRLADEEDELMESLKLIRDGLRRKQQRGRELEANGVTLELIRRYRKDYAETDWGC